MRVEDEKKKKKNSNFVPRMPFSEENQGVQGTNITFSTKENSY